MSKNNLVHSIKVPHLYKVTSKIVKTILQEGGSVKELLYTYVRANLKGAYALITKAIERNADLDRIIKKSKIIKENQKLDPWLAKVLIAEFLFGKGALQGQCKPVQTVLSYAAALQSALENSRLNEKEKYPEARRMNEGATFILFLLCTFAMFTLPFITFFTVRDILENDFGIVGFPATAWAVVSSVIVVNLIIMVYAIYAWKHDQAEIIAQSDEQKKDD